MYYLSRIKIYSLLAIVAACFFEASLNGAVTVFCDLEATLLSYTSLVLICLSVWCVFLLFVTFELNDLLLVGLFVPAILIYPASPVFAGKEPAVFILLSGAIVGKGARLLLQKSMWESSPTAASCINSEVDLRRVQVKCFLWGIVGLLSFSSCWQLKMSNFYHGPRWMGLWDNPNTYGMLMGVGVTLAIGLLAANAKLKIRNAKIFWLLTIAAGMMLVGLVMSYSRGGWLATNIGLLYLAWCYDKLKWRYILPVIIIVGLAALYFWGGTSDSAPWYIKRADLGRPSAQNRATAWRAGLEIMRDYPFGVGWNNAVRVYREKYHPPEGGPVALDTNDYLMIGTELGIVALLCFVCYAALCLRGRCNLHSEEGRIQACCRAGAIVLLVAFWFDGGLFTMATASVFWILLQLGATQLPQKTTGDTKC